MQSDKRLCQNFGLPRSSSVSDQLALAPSYIHEAGHVGSDVLTTDIVASDRWI